MASDAFEDSARIGESVKRLDGERFVTGSAEYIDDVEFADELHVAFARSQRAHAEIREVDTAAAEEMSGVHAVITGADVKERTRPMPTERLGEIGDYQYGLAVDRVRYYGEPVAAVAAETKYLAEDAADRIEIEYDRLDVVVDMEDAVAEGAPLLHPEIQDREGVDGNVSERLVQNVGDIDDGFEEADHVFEDEFRFPALSGAPLETHGCVADYDEAEDAIVLYTSTQAAHKVKNTIAHVFETPANRVQVIRPELGGGFGNKLEVRPHEICSVLLSEQLNRPVRAKLSRAEQLEVTTASFGYDMKLELGMRDDGTIVAWDEEIIQDGGAYHPWGIRKPGLNTTTLPYKVPNVRLDVRAVYTNRAPSAPVRGVTMRQLALAREVLVSDAARELGIDPVEIRLRQSVTNDECPYETAVGHRIGSSGVEEAFDRAVEEIDYENTKRSVDGEDFVGIGVACALHITSCKYGTAPDYGTIDLELDGDGGVVLRTDACEMGTGCRTTLSQIASDVTGVPMNRVRVIDGDTDKIPPGLGSWGSRTLSIMGSATQKAAAEIQETLSTVAADRLEVHPDDLEFENGRVGVQGTERSVPIVEVVADVRDGVDLPDDVTPGPLSTEATYDSGTDSVPEARVEAPDDQARGNLSLSYPASVQIVTVSVDEDTGKTTILDHVVVDDAGNAVNPEIVHGQAHGGATQAIGAAMGEKLDFDENTGQPVNSSFSDYPVPVAPEVPNIRARTVEVPSPNTPGGWKGVGEGAFVSGPAAIANAISDAIGRRVTEVPLDPETVKTLIRDGERRGDGS